MYIYTSIEREICDFAYGDLTTISPTIVSQKPLKLNKDFEFHPSGKICFKMPRVFYDGVVVEIIAKSL